MPAVHYQTFQVRKTETPRKHKCHCEGEARGNPLSPSFDESSRARTEQSFFVPRDEIVANDYDLSINKYKQTEYKPVEYPPTSEIMANLRKLESEITAAMDELEKML